MLKCRQIVEMSSDYLQGEVSLGRRLQFRLHLLMCHHCRRFTHQFAAAIAMTRKLPVQPVAQSQIDAFTQRFDKLD